MGMKECVLYRDFAHGEVLEKMTALIAAAEKNRKKQSRIKTIFMDV